MNLIEIEKHNYKFITFNIRLILNLNKSLQMELNKLNFIQILFKIFILALYIF